MNTFRRVAVFVLLIGALSIVSGWPAAARAESPANPKIGIMKFDVGGQVDPSYGLFLYDMLQGEMIASGRYTVVDWEQIDRVLGYVAKSQPNISSDQARQQAVNQLGIQKLYVGSVNKIGSRYYVTVKILNLDLTVEKLETCETGSPEGLRQCITEIAAKLIGKKSAGVGASVVSGMGRLYVETEPAGAAVKILNIKPPYRAGMELASGSYHVEASYAGYKPQRQWVSIAAGEEKLLSVRLEKATQAAASKEIEYAKGLVTQGREAQARTIIERIIETSPDQKEVAWALYYSVLWRFSRDDVEVLEKMKVYHADFSMMDHLSGVIKTRQEERGRIVKEDGRFVLYSKGVVHDTRTGLWWAAKDNGANITWGAAKSYCENYEAGGFKDWRLPTQDELAELSGSANRSRAGCNCDYCPVYLCTELIELTCCCPWASEIRGSEAAYFGFGNGERNWYTQSSSRSSRALPVRGGK